MNDVTNHQKSDKPWFIYLVKNKLNQLYAGISVDPKRRFFEHASNGPKCARALKGKGPLRLMFCAQLKTHSDALKAEIWLKKQTRKTKDAIIMQQKTVPSVIQPLDVNAIQKEVENKLSS